jgi:acetyl-CoA carboxylase beta subunit
MNWISEWALPKIKTLFGAPREVPENLWNKCPSCEQMIFHRDLEREGKRSRARTSPWCASARGDSEGT